MFQQPPKPRYRDFFIKDLKNNLSRFQILGDSSEVRTVLTKECIMYSYDMCILFQKKSGGFLPDDWIEYIVNEVGEAIASIYPEIFGEREIQRALNTVKPNIKLWSHEIIQIEVDKYYNRIK